MECKLDEIDAGKCGALFYLQSSAAAAAAAAQKTKVREEFEARESKRERESRRRRVFWLFNHLGCFRSEGETR